MYAKKMRFILVCLSIVNLLIFDCVFNDNSSKENTQPTEPPLAPTGLTADVSVPYTISLRWNDNADNERGYVLKDGRFLDTITLPPNTTQWTFTDLEKPYYSFELFAYNDVGFSSFVNSERIKVTWEYPVWYRLNIIYTESNGVSDSQAPNGFVCVYEDSVAISFTCTVGGKERVVDIISERPFNVLSSSLTLTRSDAWFTYDFDNENLLYNSCSIWASRVDSPAQIAYK